VEYALRVARYRSLAAAQAIHGPIASTRSGRTRPTLGQVGVMQRALTVAADMQPPYGAVVAQLMVAR
jgi:hypothetical protein